MDGVSDGRSINKKWLFPTGPNTIRNDYHWPKVHHVTNQDWCIWRRWIRSLDGGRNAQEPWGTWQCDQGKWKASWDAFTTINEELLYITSALGIGWTRHVRQPGRRRHLNRYFKEYMVYREIPEGPSDLKRVSYKDHHTYIEVISLSPPPLHWYQSLETYASYWGQSEVNKATVLAKIQAIINPVFLDSSRDLDILIRDNSRGTMVAISDGSYFPDSTQAAAAWIIESECGTQWIMGSLFVPGSTEDYSSYRSELTGLVASSITLRLFACGCPPPKQVIIGCDGKSALQSLSLRKDEINANLSNADLLSILADIWLSSTTRPYPVHVRGHQDQGHQGQLTRLEKLNVLMDKLATMTAAVQPSRVASLRIPFMGIRTIKHHNRYIGGNLNRDLYNGITDRQLRMLKIAVPS